VPNSLPGKYGYHFGPKEYMLGRWIVYIGISTGLVANYLIPDAWHETFAHPDHSVKYHSFGSLVTKEEHDANVKIIERSAAEHKLFAFIKGLTGKEAHGHSHHHGHGDGHHHDDHHGHGNSY